MDERLSTWLPLDDVLLISEQYLVSQAASAEVTDQVLECSISRTDQGKFSFTHELLGRFLALEGLRHAHPEPTDLAGHLRLPRHEDLPALAVELETEPSRSRVIVSCWQRAVIWASAARSASASLPGGEDPAGHRLAAGAGDGGVLAQLVRRLSVRRLPL